MSADYTIKAPARTSVHTDRADGREQPDNSKHAPVWRSVERAVRAGAIDHARHPLATGAWLVQTASFTVAIVVRVLVGAVPRLECCQLVMHHCDIACSAWYRQGLWCPHARGNNSKCYGDRKDCSLSNCPAPVARQRLPNWHVACALLYNFRRHWGVPAVRG